MKDLAAFMERVDAAVEGILVAREEQPQDLPGRQPWMGPRYVIPGFVEPISVFRTEGMALYTLARELRPGVVVEMFTGTGYSALWLAGGAPEARVYSIDNYSEGGTRDVGWAAVLALWARALLPNLQYIRGEESDLGRTIDGRLADLLFCDGPAKIRYARPEAVVVRHDNPPFPAPFPGWKGFRLLGSSHFTVHCAPGDVARLAYAVESALLSVLEIPAESVLTEVFV